MTKEGTVLDGKYEIWKEVGRGGMSIVYLARDLRLNKQWAVKEIKNDGSKSTKTLLKGLEREANILKNVDHPVLPRIVDIINQKGIIYVVMDFIEGETMAERLKKEGAQPQELVVEWGLQLASALGYLHKMNPPIIYRDMKPSNVMIKPEGGVKLIDFGTAKEYDVENNADTTALGTRGYAAPEQFGDSKGRGIYNTDERTDIYNLGATLYHIVTGMNPCEPPYEIKPIREWNSQLSSGLEKILLKCTQADPKDRYQNCDELIYALEHYHELDDEYLKLNKKKVATFAATAALSLVCGVVALVGHSGMNKIKLDNYNTYIENGNAYRSEGNYALAAEQYKKAFELDGSEAEAYDRFIQVYVDADNDVAEGSELELETGLNIIANRIKSGYADVDKNAEVIYNLALTYFDELNDYKTATKYFNMIPKNDKEFGELASYYESVSLILSSTNVDTAELMEQIHEFANYNQNEFTNQNSNKFVNYKTIGQIYATYVSVEDVAVQAENVMNQAVSDLDEYTGADLDANDYYYAYYDNLSVIYEALAKTEVEDQVEYKQNYTNVIMYAEECINILNIRVDNNAMIGIGGSYDNLYNTAYYNKMKKIADCYEAIGDYDKTVATYQKAESKLGPANVMSNKIYSEHLDYIFECCESIAQDPTEWNTKAKKELSDLLTVYQAGQEVKGIDKNKTWKKRKDTMEMLVNKGYSTTSSDEMGE